MSGQTQPETALQALAEKLRTDAIAIFGEGQAERDIIEWFYGALLAAAPATPAAQVAVPDVSAMARVLSDRAASACCVDPDDNWKIYGQEYIEDVRAILAQPAQPTVQSEAVDVVAWGWECLGQHVTADKVQAAVLQSDGVGLEPLMTVAQHQRITEALRGEVIKVAERLETMNVCADDYSRMFEESSEECDQLRAEVERLKDALEIESHRLAASTGQEVEK